MTFFTDPNFYFCLITASIIIMGLFTYLLHTTLRDLIAANAKQGEYFRKRITELDEVITQIQTGIQSGDKIQLSRDEYEPIIFKIKKIDITKK